MARRKRSGNQWLKGYPGRVARWLVDKLTQGKENRMKGKVMNSVLMFLIIALVFSFPVAEAGSRRGQDAGTKIPEEALMTVPPGVRNRKAPVPFPHAKHKGIDCTVCHHNAYETLLMSKCSSEGCHSDTTKREGKGSYFATFHNNFENSDRGCLDCHKARGKGPTSCKDCHKLIDNPAENATEDNGQ